MGFFAAIANAMPRYIIVPTENVRYYPPMAPMAHHRVQRSAWPQEDAPSFAIPANIRATDDALAAASGLPGAVGPGPDYVDYGAYTGGYGAYGWYTDHPVLIDYH